MSEYQYYEFLTVDRPLDTRQQAELRALSSRAQITATSFVNEYHWGNFRGDPRELMQRYFDAFLHITNWGTHQLMLRLPEQLLDLDTAQRYCFTDSAHAWQHHDHVIIDLCFTTEDGLDWDHTDETRLGALIPLRTDLAAGDHRALYLGWLLSAGSGLDDELEPPVPPGMAELTGPLRALAEFLRIDQDLLAVAARASEPINAQPTTNDLAGWVAALPPAQKDALLLRALNGDPHVGAELRRRLRTQHDTDPQHHSTRTAGDLLAAAAQRRTVSQ